MTSQRAQTSCEAMRLRVASSLPRVEEAIAELHVAELTSKDAGKRRTNAAVFERRLGDARRKEIDVVESEKSQDF